MKYFVMLEHQVCFLTAFDMRLGRVYARAAVRRLAFVAEANAQI